MGTFLDLPDEIIGKIATYLKDEDIFKYAVACRRVHSSLLGNSALWIRKCHTEWLNLENCISDVMGVFSGETQKLAEEASPMSFFSRRKRREHEFMRNLTEMVEIGFCQRHWDLFFQCSKIYELIPFLCRRDADFPIRVINIENKICNSLLTSIRHKIVFHTIETFRDSTDELFNYEKMILLPLSSIDQCFFTIIKERDLFYDDCYSLIKKRFPMLKSKKIPVTFVVKALTEVVISVIKRRFSGKKNEGEYFIESFLLSRVYAGEFEPHPLLLSCMVQHLCVQFGVKLSLGYNFLIIHHNSLQEETYLVIRRRTKYEYQIITKQALMRSFGVRSERHNVLSNSTLDKITSVKNGGHVTRDFFLNLIAHYPRTRERYYHFYSKSDPCSWNGDFPAAKQGIDIHEVQYFNTLWHLLNRMANIECISDDKIIRNKLSKIMMKQYPEDLGSGLSFMNNDESWVSQWSFSLKEFLGQVYPTHFMRGPTVGKFVRNKCDQSVIGLALNHLRYSSEEEIVMFLTCEGTFSYAYAKELEVFEWYEVDDILVSTFLTMNRHTRLDFFFRQIVLDNGKLKLEPLESVYEPYHEELCTDEPV